MAYGNTLSLTSFHKRKRDMRKAQSRVFYAVRKSLENHPDCHRYHQRHSDQHGCVGTQSFFSLNHVALGFKQPMQILRARSARLWRSRHAVPHQADRHVAENRRLVGIGRCIHRNLPALGLRPGKFGTAGTTAGPRRLAVPAATTAHVFSRLRRSRWQGSGGAQQGRCIT